MLTNTPINLDLSSLSADKFYPIIFEKVNKFDSLTFQIVNSGSTPSWTTSDYNIDLNFSKVSYAWWGINQVGMVSGNLAYSGISDNIIPLQNLGELQNFKGIFFYLRGGATYDLYSIMNDVEFVNGLFGVNVVISTTDYTNSETGQVLTIKDKTEFDTGLPSGETTPTKIDLKISDADKMLSLYGNILSSFMKIEDNRTTKKIRFLGKNNSEIGVIDTTDFLEDKFLKSVGILPGTKKLRFIFILSDGTEKIVDIDLSDIVDEELLVEIQQELTNLENNKIPIDYSNLLEIKQNITGNEDLIIRSNNQTFKIKAALLLRAATPNLSKLIYEFSVDDVVDNFLYINHKLNSEDLLIQVYNNEKQLINPDSIILIDNNNIKIEFTNFEIAGIFKVVILSLIPEILRTAQTIILQNNSKLITETNKQIIIE